MTFCVASQQVRGSTIKNYLQQALSSSEMYGREAAGPVSVRYDAEAPADCQHEKDLQTQGFSKRLKGFEPSTFCMASRTCSSDAMRKVAANRLFSSY